MIDPSIATAYLYSRESHCILIIQLARCAAARTTSVSLALMATPGSAPDSYLLLLILLLLCPLAVPCSGDGGYDVVSVARSGSALSARLELVGETPTDTQRLSLTARQV